jgi:hypothetical protein
LGYEDVLDLEICEYETSESKGVSESGVTSMDDVIPMTVLQRAPNLPGKLSCDSLPQPTMADDIIEHLTAVDVLENHVVVVLVHDHLAHAAYIWVMQEHGECSLAQSSDLSGSISGSLSGGGIGGGGMDTVGCPGGWGGDVNARKYFHSQLGDG